MDRPRVTTQGTSPCPALHRRTALASLTSSWPKPRLFSATAPPPLTSASGRAWPCFCTTAPCSPTSRPAFASSFIPTRSASGGSVGPKGCSSWRINPAAGVSPLFPPLDRAAVVALACERVAQTQAPLSRQSLADLARAACVELGKPLSRTTVKRILDEDAIKPWQYEHWIFPRDPNFYFKAARVLDLYEGYWQGERLEPFDRVISADEKTSIQARARCHATLPPGPGRCRRIEHEYERGGALQYLAAWDVQEGRVMGRCEAKTGIEPFGRLVGQVMRQPQYREAPRVFWVVDNGSSHRGEASVRRMLGWYGNAVLVHTPVHASWLNQVEIYFSLVQRKALTPNDFASVQEVELRLRLYEELTNRTPRPFDWRFTKYDLFDLLQRLASKTQVKPRSAVHTVLEED
jgi:hypothetical protein